MLVQTTCTQPTKGIVSGTDSNISSSDVDSGISSAAAGVAVAAGGVMLAWSSKDASVRKRKGSCLGTASIANKSLDMCNPMQCTCALSAEGVSSSVGSSAAAGVMIAWSSKHVSDKAAHERSCHGLACIISDESLVICDLNICSQLT